MTTKIAPRKKPPAPSVKPTRGSGSGSFPRFYIIESYRPFTIDGSAWQWSEQACYIIWQNRNTHRPVDWEGHPIPTTLYDQQSFNYRLNCLMEDMGILRSVSREEAELHRAGGRKADA